MAAPTGSNPKGDATKVLRDAIASAEAGHDSVSIESSVEGGLAGILLVEASRGADLLVVGSRRHSELVSVVLASVSEHCVTHALSPVLVVRDVEILVNAT